MRALRTVLLMQAGILFFGPQGPSSPVDGAAACAIEWLRQALEVRVLDDSTDEATKHQVRASCERIVAQIGIYCRWIDSVDRKGYKPDALDDTIYPNATIGLDGIQDTGPGGSDDFLTHNAYASFLPAGRWRIDLGAQRFLFDSKQMLRNRPVADHVKVSIEFLPTARSRIIVCAAYADFTTATGRGSGRPNSSSAWRWRCGCMPGCDTPEPISSCSIKKAISAPKSIIRSKPPFGSTSKPGRAPAMASAPVPGASTMWPKRAA